MGRLLRGQASRAARVVRGGALSVGTFGVGTFGVGVFGRARALLSAADPGPPRVAAARPSGRTQRLWPAGRLPRRIVGHPVPVTVAHGAGCRLTGVAAATARVAPSRFASRSRDAVPGVIERLVHECSAVPAQGLRGGVSLCVSVGVSGGNPGLLARVRDARLRAHRVEPGPSVCLARNFPRRHLGRRRRISRASDT